MPRAPRFQTIEPQLPHHVILRGNNQRLLFSYPSDRAAFVRYVLAAPHADACPVHAAALMSNHVHLVVTPESVEALSRWVKSFSQRYAIARNRSRETSGKLFEQRFDAKVIRTDRQLAATLAYVDMNPARAGLGANTTAWSTLALHLGHDDGHPLRELWRPCAWWLSLGATVSERGLVYDDFVRNRVADWGLDVVRGRAPATRDYRHTVLRPDGRRAAGTPRRLGPQRTQEHVQSPSKNVFYSGHLRGEE